MKQALLLSIPFLSIILSQTQALASISCQRAMPRCNSANCGNPPYYGQDWTDGTFLPGSHKSPSYSPCTNPPAGQKPDCTDDYFRSPSSWDYTASTADYMYIWYATNPSPAGANVWVYDDWLGNLLTTTQWNNVVSIDYVDLDIGWSTYNTQTISVEYCYDYCWSSGQSMTGNYPNGSLNYWRFTTNPFTHSAWTKADVYAPTPSRTSRSWMLDTENNIDGNTPGGLFIHSITETVYFTYNGTSCP